MLIELEALVDFSLQDGMIWIGDLSEVVSKKALAEIHEKAKGSFKGYVCNLNDSVEFFILNRLDDSDTYVICEVTHDEVKEVDDVVSSCGFIMVIHETELEMIVKRPAELESGVFVHLPIASEVKVNFRGFHLGDHFHIER
jgi:hypothetical protein